MKARLQPLPKKEVSGTSSGTSALAAGISAGGPGWKAPIQPRRMALKFDTSTLVIEYKDPASGKLRHRSFHIDTSRFRDTTACVEKLSAKLGKVVVPGSIPSEQLHRLVDKLWHNGVDVARTHQLVPPGTGPARFLRNCTSDAGQLAALTDPYVAPDLDDLEAETNAFMEKHRPQGEDGLVSRFKPDIINYKDGEQAPAAKKILNALPRKVQATREIARDGGKECSTQQDLQKEQDEGLHPAEAPQGAPLLAAKHSGPALEQHQQHHPRTEPQTSSKSLDLRVETSPTSKDSSSERKGPDAKVLSPGAESVPSEIAEYVSDFEDVEESPGKENSLKHLDSENAEGMVQDGETSFERKKRLEGDDVDLNNVDQEELDEYKRLMEVNFQKHAILPGDPRYKHDVQVEFSDPEEDCGWDEEDDSGDEDVDPFLP